MVPTLTIYIAPASVVVLEPPRYCILFGVYSRLDSHFYLNMELKFHLIFREFGELHSRAIDERWYKSAVLQHQYDKESFVYAIADNEDNEENILITGSYAIFPKDNGKEAPGSVVGFQFGQNELRQRFREITTKPSVRRSLTSRRVSEK